MEVKYYKDFRHNYMILRSIDIPENKYQIRMITDNNIKGLLSCKEKHINGEMFLYYEITSKQSFASLYDCQRIGIDVLSRLFIQLKTVWDNMSRFLLEEKYLMLNPEYIFLDIENKDFYFLYYPFESQEDYIQILFDFLTEKVDSEDDKAVDVSYKALELIEKEQFVLDEILKWFEEDILWEEGDNEEQKRTNENIAESFSQECDAGKYVYQTNKKILPNIKTKIIGKMLLFLLGVAAVCLYIYQCYEMSEINLLYLYALLLTDFLFVLLCIGYVIYRKASFFNKEKISMCKNVDITQEGSNMNFTEEDYLVEKAECGNTIFIPWTEHYENILYGIGKGNKYHIDINHLPMTVGKLSEVVDMVIDEQSISRRHVKFSREDGKICMTDLNSTNGTFKNGLRLEPNASEFLEPGDEIRLGKLKFIYR